MSGSPGISVIIPSYNSARFVVEAVESALAQTVPPDEIIVVDDGSTDDTQARLLPYRGSIRCISQRNAGVAAARNRGIRESRGSLIAFLDADDRWLPRKLERQLECLAARPDVDLVHTDLRYWNDQTGELTPSLPGRERFVGFCIREFFWWCGVNTSTVLLRRRCLDEVGLFDELIPGGYSEDLDLFLRIAPRFQLAFVPEPLVHYRRHGNNATSDRRRIQQSAFWVFERALAAEPALVKSLGRRDVRRHMRSLAFGAAYLHVEAGDLRGARRLFRGALRYGPTSLYAWALWASTLIPQAARSRLRSIKQRLATRRKSAVEGTAPGPILKS